jgi:hypothetical protein
MHARDDSVPPLAMFAMRFLHAAHIASGLLAAHAADMTTAA